MKIFLTSFFVLFLSLFAKSQSYTIQSSPLLTYLYKTKNEISIINKTGKLQLFPVKLGNVNGTFTLIKNKNGLFALVDGTGKVYKATNLNDSKITFTRIDSTYFSGNNFNAINFSYNGLIYSFGGYGYWNKNGQLIHFTEGAEWSIDKINEKYRAENWLFNYLPKESKIFYVEFPWIDESTNFNHAETSIIEFDLLKKKNTKIGKLNDKLKLQYNYFNINVPSLNANIAGGGNEMLLLNFSTNKVYRLANNKLKDELISRSTSEIQTLFEDEGKVFYTFVNDTTLRSYKISMSDFKEEPYPLYTSVNKELYNELIIAILVIAFVVLLFIIYKKRTKNNLPATSENEESYSLDLNSNEFNSIEINLISKLIEKSNKDSFLTLDELNTYLGIKRKAIEIQKRVRAEAINRINHKFNVNFNVETTFIERTRSAEDRRYFNYIINKENAKVYLKKFSN